MPNRWNPISNDKLLETFKENLIFDIKVLKISKHHRSEFQCKCVFQSINKLSNTSNANIRHITRHVEIKVSELLLNDKCCDNYFE